MSIHDFIMFYMCFYVIQENPGQAPLPTALERPLAPPARPGHQCMCGLQRPVLLGLVPNE